MRRFLPGSGHIGDLDCDSFYASDLVACDGQRREEYEEELRAGRGDWL